MQGVLGGTADTVGKGVGGVTNTAGNAGKPCAFSFSSAFIFPGWTHHPPCPASQKTCFTTFHIHIHDSKSVINLFLMLHGFNLNTTSLLTTHTPTVGGLGNVLGDTLKGTTGTLGDATKGVGNVAKDTTGGVGDTARSATGAKQDSQNPLGLSE